MPKQKSEPASVVTRVRRATPQDAVAIYRGIPDKPVHDEAAFIGHILRTIAIGFVLVVETQTQRYAAIIGSIGFMDGAPVYAKQALLKSEWVDLTAPSVDAHFAEILEKLEAFTTEHKVEAVIEGELPAKFMDAMETAGFFFQNRAVLGYVPPDVKEDEPLDTFEE
jgi:hypothetical protein